VYSCLWLVPSHLTCLLWTRNRWNAKKSPHPWGYPISVFNKNSTLRHLVPHCNTLQQIMSRNTETHRQTVYQTATRYLVSLRKTLPRQVYSTTLQQTIMKPRNIEKYTLYHAAKHCNTLLTRSRAMTVTYWISERETHTQQEKASLYMCKAIHRIRNVLHCIRIELHYVHS